MVKTVCYGHKDEWGSRQEALEYYTGCYYASEGSERERYASIIVQLAEGKDYCTDGETERN